MSDPLNKDTTGHELGAVTFLDVLGWKGIWLDQGTKPTDTLLKIVQNTRIEAEKITAEYTDHEDFRGVPNVADTTKVISISDTIVIFSKGDTSLAIEIQARICAWLLKHALLQGIPLRGAISFGEYFEQDNVMQGAAVDEVASWYEFVDWIGVILTPSAHLQIKSNQIKPITRYEEIPFKKKFDHLDSCVDWNFDESTTDGLKKIILRKMPLTPEIAPKYLNTLAFLERNKTTPST